MTKPDYGTKEYYKQYFSDILADAATGETNDKEKAMLLLQAFREAVQDWLDYHQQSADTYATLLHEFLDDNWGTLYGPVDEELELPSIPEFPSFQKRVDALQIQQCDV